MRKTTTFMLAIMLAVFCSVSLHAQESEQRRIKIGFSPFLNKATAVEKNKSYYGNGYVETTFSLDSFVDLLQTALVKTRRFEVIERTQLDQILKEQGMAASGLMDEESGAVSGAISGIDYILMGTITKCGTTQKTMSVSGYEQVVRTLEFSVDFRLTDVSTGGIVLSDFVNVSLDSVQMKTDSYSNTATSENDISNVMRKASLQSGFLIANALSPVQVEAVKGKKVKINYGHGFIEAGQIYRIFPSEDADSWDTGFDEIAKVRILTVQPTYSIAEIVEGDEFNVMVGCACSKITSEEEKKFLDQLKLQEKKDMGKRFGY